MLFKVWSTCHLLFGSGIQVGLYVMSAGSVASLSGREKKTKAYRRKGTLDIREMSLFWMDQLYNNAGC